MYNAEHDIKKLKITFNDSAKKIQELHEMARNQFMIEHQEGSRSSTRGLLLAEIGTSIQSIYRELEKIKLNIIMLDDVPIDIDEEAAESHRIF